MELWLRFRTAARLSWDASYEVHSFEQWDQIIRETRPLSSILWPTGSLFRVLLPLLDELRTFCYTCKIEDIPESLVARA